MTLSALLDTMRADAASRRATVLSDADRRVERIRAASEAALERQRAEVLERVRSEEESAARRAVARAEAEAKRSVLVARERLLERVRAALEEMIDGASDDPEYVASLPSQLSRSLARLPPGPVVVRARAPLARAIDVVLRAPGLAGLRSWEVEAVEGMGVGFTAISESGMIEVDATLDERLEHAWPELAVRALAEVAA